MNNQDQNVLISIKGRVFGLSPHDDILDDKLALDTRGWIWN